MSKPFDAVTKFLIENFPADWLRRFGLPCEGPIELLDADLATVTSSADKVMRIGGGQPWILHLELQASRDPDLARRTLRYNVLIHHKYALPVHSVVVLLRPEADTPFLTGRYNYASPAGKGSMEFRFQVERLWTYPVKEFLEGGIGTLPLVPLTSVDPKELRETVRFLEDRFQNELPPGKSAELEMATFVLSGLRIPPEIAIELFKGARTMKESSTYQWILEEGRTEGRIEGRREGQEMAKIEEALSIVLRLGERRFGPASMPVRQALMDIKDLGSIEELATRVLDVTNWNDLITRA